MKVGDKVEIVNDLARDYVFYRIIGEIATIIQDTGPSTYRRKDFHGSSALYKYFLNNNLDAKTFNIYKVSLLNKTSKKEFFYLFDADLRLLERILRIL